MKCPRCDVNELHHHKVMNSLSRCTRGENDKHVYVCNACGNDEAFEQFNSRYDVLDGLTPMSKWPVNELTNKEMVDVIQRQTDIFITEQMEVLNGLGD